MSKILTDYSPEEFQLFLNESVRLGIINATPLQSSPPSTDELITENEAKEFLSVSKVTLKKWRDENRIKFYRIGSRIRYKKSELLASLESPVKYGRTKV